MTSDRHDPDPAPELRDEFWGEQTEWTAQPRPSSEREGVGAIIGRWWDGLLGGGAGGTAGARRVHGQPSAGVAHDHAEHDLLERDRADRDRAEHASADPDELVDDAWEIEPEPQPVRGPGVDPLIARLGVVAVILTLAAPLVVGFTASGSDSDSALMETIAGDQPAAQVDPIAPEPTQTAAATESTRAAPDTSPASAPATDAAPETSAQSVPAASTSSAPVAAAAAALEAPTATEPADTAPATTPATTVPACGNRYELAAGDYWIRIADAADVSLADLLEVNDATVDTVLVPGRSICLPVGASTPAPPTTVTATTPSTRAPAAAPTNDATSTRPPATTVAPAPTTTAPPRPAAVPGSEATAIIRDVWPDELEERALEIAWRESNHRSNVDNWCCYGLFQIHWEAHRSWLATIGVTSVSQLYDPRLNSIAAFTLYQRAGGWGPWGG